MLGAIAAYVSLNSVIQKPQAITWPITFIILEDHLPPLHPLFQEAIDLPRRINPRIRLPKPLYTNIPKDPIILLGCRLQHDPHHLPRPYFRS